MDKNATPHNVNVTVINVTAALVRKGRADRIFPFRPMSDAAHAPFGQFGHTQAAPATKSSTDALV